MNGEIIFRGWIWRSCQVKLDFNTGGGVKYVLEFSPPKKIGEMLQVDEHFFCNWVVFNHQDMVGNDTWNEKTYRWSIPPSGGSYGRDRHLEAVCLFDFAGSEWGMLTNRLLIIHANSICRSRCRWTVHELGLRPSSCSDMGCGIRSIANRWEPHKLTEGQSVLLLVAVVLFPRKFSQDLLWNWEFGVGFVTHVFHLQTSLSNTLATWMSSFCNRGKYSWKRNEWVCCCFYHLGGGFKYFSPTWGDDPISLIFFRWVETTT